MRLLAAAVTGLLLAGCATVPGTHPEPGSAQLREQAWARHAEALAPIDRFLLNGRVVSNELKLRADLRWKQDADERFELRLSGPFGAGAVELRGDTTMVEVRSGDGNQFTPDPEGWIRSRYGWALPIAGLRHWVLGLPSPDTPAEKQVDDQGRLSQLVQNGWSVTYTEYRRQGAYDLPRRFEADNGQIKLKLIVDRWDDLPKT